jgi:hypothetical protein
MGVGAGVVDAAVVVEGDVIADHAFFLTVFGARFATLFLAATIVPADIAVARSPRVVMGNRTTDHCTSNRRRTASVATTHGIAERATYQGTEQGGTGVVAMATVFITITRLVAFDRLVPADFL